MNNVTLNLMIIGYIVSNYYVGKELINSVRKVTTKEVILNNIKLLIIMLITITPVFSIPILKYIFIIVIVRSMVNILIQHIINKGKILKTNFVVFLLTESLSLLLLIVINIVIFTKQIPVNYISPILFMEANMSINFYTFLQIILTILIILKPISYLTRTTLDLYKPTSGTDKEDNTKDNAGSLIGILERGIIMIFLIVNQFSAIGFVLTAKSIARYNKISHDQAFAEYYLIGTLLSTILVLITYFLVFQFRIFS